MKREKILQALDEISDAHIEKAATPPKRKRKSIYWYSGIAAVLVIAILLGIFLPTGKSPADEMVGSNAKVLAAASYPETKPADDYKDILAHADDLNDYFRRTMAQFLQDEQGNDNMAFSPINLYMALAMLAETTDGQTRAEILSLLGAEDMDSLRKQANELWLSIYSKEEPTCTLANSIWIQDGVSYNEETVKTIAEKYFASVYSNNFAAPNAAKPIAQWIDKETGGLLKEQTAQLQFDPRTVMALVSTVYMKANWTDPYKEERNTQRVFHGTNGDVTRTFMNKSYSDNYYWGDDYTAVSVGLEWGYSMKLILPDEGKTPNDLLQSGAYTELLRSGAAKGKYTIINLSMPKFDITCKQNMIDGLTELGIKQVFEMGQADFSSAFPEMANEIAVGKVEQATRVSVDEDGIEAASYVVIGGEGGGAPKDEVDFVLDRPFLFVITHRNIPIFAGVVNNP